MNKVFALFVFASILLFSCAKKEESPTAPPTDGSTVATVEITPSTLQLLIGESLNAQAKAKDQSGSVVTGKKCVWTSSNTSIVRIDTVGNVIALAAGTCSVTASIETKSASVTATVTAPGPWTATTSMKTARAEHTATVLDNGQVLVAGGRQDTAALASCEIYDPASGAWTATGSMASARFNHVAVLLKNGKVLVSGGYGGRFLSSNEIYDPSTGNWAPAGNLTTARNSHVAMLLDNGNVLVVGGYNGNGLASCELFDAASGSWTVTGSLTVSRYEPGIVMLASKRVLVCGGGSGAGGSHTSCEIYDPSSGAWTATGSMSKRRYYPSCTLLSNGCVLIGGGQFFDGTTAYSLNSCELYNPTAGTCASTGSMKNSRTGQVSLAFGRGLVVAVAEHYEAKSEAYSVALGTWCSVVNMAAVRYNPGVVSLKNGRILVTGGEFYDLGVRRTLATCEML